MLQIREQKYDLLQILETPIVNYIGMNVQKSQFYARKESKY